MYFGGLALKNTFTRRYERKEFETLKKEIFKILSKTFRQYDLPRFFNKKESFGDMDIIISREGFNGDIRKYIEKTFKPNEIFHNGNAYSFDYKELQIDFIMVHPEDFDSNYHYLAFNDLGNFIGRLAQQLGLKYGQEGLWYNHFHNGQKVGRIEVSKDYPKIFKFLNLDYNRWIKGFDTLEEIFEYAMSSKYFNPHNFQLSQLNKINRDRNLKRKSYMSFLDYIEGKNPHPNYNQEEIDKIKSTIVKIANKEFPESKIDMEVKRLEYEDAKKAYATSKFNGHMVMERYNIKGKQLGIAMKEFKELVKEEFNDMDYEEVIIKLDEDLIFKLFDIVIDDGVTII